MRCAFCSRINALVLKKNPELSDREEVIVGEKEVEG
jgi:hypothetical protein